MRGKTGANDPLIRFLAQELADLAPEYFEKATRGIIVNGRIAGTAIGSPVPTTSGGTGRQDGQATPLDGSVTDVKVATGAAVDPAKLDQTKLLALAYLLVKGYLIAGSGLTISSDDLAHTLTLSSSGGVKRLVDLTDVVIVNPMVGDVLLLDADGFWRNYRGTAVGIPAGALTLEQDLLTINGEPLTVGGDITAVINAVQVGGQALTIAGQPVTVGG